MITSPIFVTRSENQQKFADWLKSGRTLTMQPPAPHDVPVLRNFIASPEFATLNAQWNAALAKARVAALDPIFRGALEDHAPTIPAAQRVDYERALVGAAAGTMTGVGVGIVVQALASAAAPHNPAAMLLAFGLIGGGIGAAMGGGVVSEVQYDPATRVVTLKGPK